MKAEVVYFFAFDVANEIDTRRIQSILSESPLPFHVQTDQTHPRGVPLYRPLAVERELESSLNGRPLRCLIRIYEFGALTVTLRTARDVARLSDLLPLHNPRTSDDRTLDEVARELRRQVHDSLQDLLVRPTPSTDPEAYTAFCLTELGGELDVNRWLAKHRREVAGLLSEFSAERLSETQVAEVLRLQRSFESSDLVVIDWDAALVVDLGGYVDDVLYVLELANLQLEEFRAMDRNLDAYLDRAYSDLQRRSLTLFGTASAVLRVLREYRVDMMKLSDEVTHSTKFFGDWYLARVYMAARERFYLDQWRNSVERRLGQLDQLYGVVKSEIYEQRMLWLEILIVVFFAIDLVAILFLKK